MRFSTGKTILLGLISLAVVFPVSATETTSGQDTSTVRLVLDTSETCAVLSILALRQVGKPVEETEWQELFSTAPYRRLKERQDWIAKRFHDTSLVLRDADFKAFVLSDGLLSRSADLRATLNRWTKANLDSSARALLDYLPASAKICATIYPVIKPGTNSFVWDVSVNPAIFLYLDPKISPEEFANTVTHELHHIGFSSVNSGYDSTFAALPERAHTVAEWIGGFGEGMAMLAAAGGPDIHPHAVSPAKERARWDKDMADFNHNLLQVDSFLVAVLTGTLADKDSIEERGSSFYGIQGPWYTVGYKMCIMVEKEFGRAELIKTMLDPRRLLVLYNRAAREHNASGSDKLPLWSEDMLKQIKAE